MENKTFKLPRKIILSSLATILVISLGIYAIYHYHKPVAKSAAATKRNFQ